MAPGWSAPSEPQGHGYPFDLIAKYGLEAYEEEAENPEDLATMKNWRTFMEDFRTFCLTAPHILEFFPVLAYAGLTVVPG